MALTSDQVHAAADAIVERGENPKLTNVRKQLGGGSFTTISEAMQSWRQQHAQEAMLQQTEVPDSITSRLTALGAAVWTEAMSESDSRLQSERALLDQAREEAASQVKEAGEMVTALESEAAEREEKIQSLSNELDEQRRLTDQSKADIAALTERLSSRDQQISDLKEQLKESKDRASRFEQALIDRDKVES